MCLPERKLIPPPLKGASGFRLLMGEGDEDGGFSACPDGDGDGAEAGTNDVVLESEEGVEVEEEEYEESELTESEFMACRIPF